MVDLTATPETPVAPPTPLRTRPAVVAPSHGAGAADAKKRLARQKRRARDQRRRAKQKEVTLATQALVNGDDGPIVEAIKKGNSCAIKAYPSIARVLQSNLAAEAVQQALEITLLSLPARSSARQKIVAMFDAASGGKIPAETWLRSNIDPGYVRVCRHRLAHQQFSIDFFLEKYDSTNVPASRIQAAVKDAIETFFKANTFVFSGANRHTRNLTVQKYVLFARLHAAWPGILRLLPCTPDRDTSLFNDMNLARQMATETGFDAKTEYDARLDEALRHHAWTLAKARVVRGGGIVKAGPDDTCEPHAGRDLGQPHTVTALGNESFPLKPVTLSAPRAPAEATFWATLKERGVRYTRCFSETRCRLHDNGPVWKSRLSNVIERMAKMCATDSEYANLEAEKLTLTQLVDHYDQHMLQYKTQRPYLKQLERDLEPGQAIVYRDFVNMYTAVSDKVNGNQLKNLVLVVLWRDEKGAPLQVRKLSNLCGHRESRSCDAYFVRDVFEFHMSPKDDYHTGYLNGFKKIYVAGDHGPHFVALKTLLNESMMKSKYGVDIECVFLCSYHAFNRCDGAGVELIRLALWAFKAQRYLRSAKQHAALLNGSQYDNHEGFEFKRINKDKSLFPEVIQKPAGVLVKRVCEFHFPSPGVVAAKYVSDAKAPYDIFFDLVPRTIMEPLCGPCSLKNQAVIHHTTCTAAVEARQTTRSGATPNDARISGMQDTSAARKIAKKPLGRFPCKVKGCVNRFYNSVYWANNHMVTNHANTEYDGLYSKSKGVKRKRSDKGEVEPSDQAESIDQSSDHERGSDFGSDSQDWEQPRRCSSSVSASSSLSSGAPLSSSASSSLPPSPGSSAQLCSASSSVLSSSSTSVSSSASSSLSASSRSSPNSSASSSASAASSSSSVSSSASSPLSASVSSSSSASSYLSASSATTVSSTAAASSSSSSSASSSLSASSASSSASSASSSASASASSSIAASPVPAVLPQPQDIMESPTLLPGEPDPSAQVANWTVWMAKCYAGGTKYSTANWSKAEKDHGQRCVTLSSGSGGRSSRRAKTLGLSEAAARRLQAEVHATM